MARKITLAAQIHVRLKNTLLNAQRVFEEIGEEIKKPIELNENESTICQELWNTVMGEDPK